MKENAPSQAFEASLLSCVDRLVPGVVATPLAVEPDRGWLATADLGLPMWHDGTTPPVDDWVAALGGYAVAQHALSAHGDEVLDTGIPLFPHDPDEVVDFWVAGLAAALGDLPADDARRLTDDEAAAVGEGLPAIRDAARTLAESDIPASLQHNDLHLGNAFRRPDGGIAYIDLGDALWTHPFTAARIPLWIMRHRFRLDPGHPDLARAVDSFLEPWSAGRDPQALRDLLPAAERLSCLHRAECWRRLQADVPARCIPGTSRRSVPEWLVDAVAPDPFVAAAGR